MANKIEVPAFKSEAEEAEWWYANREEDDERLIEAMDDGSARRLVDVLFEHGLTLEGLKEVVIPVQEGDVEVAMERAMQAGMNFREYMGKVLHEALKGQRAA